MSGVTVVADHRWEITIEKWSEYPPDTVNTVVTVWARSAQEATKQIVDLSTNNTKVVFFSVGLADVSIDPS